jgi:integrase
MWRGPGSSSSGGSSVSRWPSARRVSIDDTCASSWTGLATVGDTGWDADPLSDRFARDHAARDFRRWLKVERRAAASTVNLALASLDALYRQRGMGNPNVRREKPVRAAPRALEQDDQRQLLRACERAPRE